MTRADYNTVLKAFEECMDAALKHDEYPRGVYFAYGYIIKYLLDEGIEE